MKSEVVPEKDFATTVADELVTAIGEVLDEQESCSICLSGGTTPAAVYRLLGLPPRTREIQWPKINIFWGDERFVPGDDPKNNARMVHDTLLHHFREDGPSVYPIDTSAGSASEAASAYEATIRSAGYFTAEKSPPFDIVLLGLGEDGHIASVFPGHAVPTDKLVYSCEHPSDGTERISLTPHVLFAGKRVFFLVSGSSKEPVVTRVLNEERLSPSEIPAAHAHSSEGEVLWFLDRKAAGVI